MESKHTQGKLKVSGYLSTDSVLIASETIKDREHDFILIKSCYRVDMPYSVSEANAERIVTLWNAMDGLTNEEVSILRIRYQNLLQAAKDTVAFMNNNELGYTALLENQINESKQIVL